MLATNTVLSIVVKYGISNYVRKYQTSTICPLPKVIIETMDEPTLTEFNSDELQLKPLIKSLALIRGPVPELLIITYSINLS